MEGLAGRLRGACPGLEVATGSSDPAGFDIVVNATTVGLDPAVKGGPFVVDIVRSHHVVMDLVYGPATTDLVRQARKRGAAAVDGLEMLLMQAAGSYQLWTGRRPSLDVMRAALASVGR